MLQYFIWGEVMKQKTRLEDIATALGISRNTVSKAFNNRYLPEKTKLKILNKAIEMGYKNLPSIASRETVLNNKNILILTINNVQNLDFFLSVIRGINDIVIKYDLNLFQYQFDSLEKIKVFKSYCALNQIAGILCLETFESKYIKHILSMNLPTVFIDAHIDGLSYYGNYDIVLMESTKSVSTALNKIIFASNIKHIGFVGDKNHCMSFNERYIGYQIALLESNLTHDPYFDIIEPDSFAYGDVPTLSSLLKKKAQLPECYVCANDFLAISMINALENIGYRVPQDIQIIGFDNTQESKQFKVPLTTIDTDKHLLGKESMATLLNRVKYHEKNNRLIYIKTSAIFRDSTK